MTDLTGLYESSLAACCANDMESQEDAFRLRYQVYCLERGYEDAAAYPRQMEVDQYDGNAQHMLVRSRSCGIVLGATRLVLDDGGFTGLPMEALGSGSVAHQLARTRSNEHHQIAEVSRLAVTRMMPRGLPAESLLPKAQPLIPVNSQHVSMGLLALLFLNSWTYGVTHWVALLESSLMRFLKRVGIHCQPIGSVVEHRGMRQPVMGSVDDLWAGVLSRGSPLAGLVESFTEGDADFSRKPVVQAGSVRIKKA